MRFLRIDRFGTPLGDVEGVLSARRKRDVSGTDTLELTMTGPLEKDDRVVARDSKGRWCEWICTSPHGERKDNVPPYGTCVLQGSVRELSRKMHVEVRNRNASARDALTRCLEGTRWEVGTIDVSTTASVSYYHETAYQALLDLCKAFECEYEASYVVSGNYVTRRIISLYDRRGSASVAHRFEYGRDLPGIVRTVADEDVVTRLYGYGKGTPCFDEQGDFTGGYHRRISFADINNGKEYVEDASLVSTWGMVGPTGSLVPAEGVVFFNDCEDPAELLELTRAELARHSAPIVEYQCDVLALARAGEDFEGADIGDTVRVVDTSFPNPVRIEARVLEIDESLTDGVGGTTLGIGNATETYTQRTAAALQTLRELQGMYKAWNEAAGSFPTYLNQVLLGLNAIINDSDGWSYLVPGLGFVTYDVEVSDPSVGAEASRVTEIRGGTLRFANSRDSSGNWEYRTVIVSGHVAADMVTAGYITAGYIGDPNGNNYWDIDNDTLRVAANIIAGGANNQNGTITVLDANGNVICLLDSSGASIVGALTMKMGGFNSSANTYSLLGEMVWTGWILGSRSTGGRTLHGLKLHTTGETRNNELLIAPVAETSYSSGQQYGLGAILSKGKLVIGACAGEVSDNPQIAMGQFYDTAIVLTSGVDSGYRHRVQLDDSNGFQVSCTNDIFHVKSTNSYGTAGEIYGCGSLTVTGFKSRVVETPDYGDRLLYCFETARPMFGDVGGGAIGDDGTCYVEIDDILSETVRTDVAYHVFLQAYGAGELWVSERNARYFVVEGTAGLEFGWEVKAVQSGYEHTRTESYESYAWEGEEGAYGANLDQAYAADLAYENEIEALYGGEYR